MVPHQESAALAERLIAATCEKHEIVPGQLTIHADRGSSMTSKPVAWLLADLGVTRPHRRHGAIGLLPPAMVHYGQVEAVRARRAEVLAAAYIAHPERFVRRPPQA